MTNIQTTGNTISMFLLLIYFSCWSLIEYFLGGLFVNYCSDKEDLKTNSYLCYTTTCFQCFIKTITFNLHKPRIQISLMLGSF